MFQPKSTPMVLVVVLSLQSLQGEEVESFEFSDFSDLSSFTFLGSAASIHGAGPVFYDNQPVLRLTDNLWQAGGAFLVFPLLLKAGNDKVAFTTYFQFQITDPCGITDSADGIQGADGLAFVFAGQNNILGGVGGGLGYLGVPQSIGIEIDTFYNAGAVEPDGNHIGINLYGDLRTVRSSAISPPFNNGNIWNMWIDYSGETSTLDVFVSEVQEKPREPALSYRVGLLGIVGAQAYMGFTSGTGAACNDHDIRYWSYSSWTSSKNLAPGIFHTVIDSIQKGKEIPFSFQVIDDTGELSSIAIFFRLRGQTEYDKIDVVPNPPQTSTHYDVGLSGLTDTLTPIEYYIQATDREGLSGFSGTPENPHIICITDPQRKTPVIIIPGIMGTELWDDENNELIWIDPKKAADPRDLIDSFLLRLKLESDGITPDRTNRCYSAFSIPCNSWLDCPLASTCLLPGPNCCVIGGRRTRVGAITNIEGCCFIEGFTAYKELVRYFEARGYTFNKDLFLLGYDWRVDLRILPVVLRREVERLTPGCQDKVNIIAHSMGGLLLRAYLKDYPVDHRVDTAVYLGTPHQGSPRAYAVLKWKESIFASSLLKHLFSRKTISFIAQNFPSVYQLLPRSEFLIDKNGRLERIQESFKSLSNQNHVVLANSFHQSIENFNPVERSFAINGSGQYTLAYFRINNKGDVEVFPDIRGDGTVPRNSSSEFVGTQDFFVNGEHDKLPGIQAVQEKILKILEGNENELVGGIQDRPFEAAEMMRWSSFSPITVNITDLQGNITGQDEAGEIQEDIPGSAFFVFDHNEAGFLPKNNEYHVDIQALETGIFTLLFETIDKDGNSVDSLVYQDIPISSNGKGEIFLSSDNPSPELLLDVDGDGDSDFQVPPEESAPEELQRMFVENGDVNRDKKVDISDAVSILGHLFLGSTIACPQAANANGDQNTDISDSIYILGYLFLGTASKPEGLIYCP